MPRKLAGKAAIHGVDGTMTFDSIATTQFKIQSYSLKDNAEKSRLQQGDGDIIGKAATGKERLLTLEFIVIGDDTPSTLADAQAASKLPLDIFTVITLAATNLTDLTGDWNYESGSFDGRIGDYLKFTFELSQVEVAAGTFDKLTPV
jgi:hypothetical protein